MSKKVIYKENVSTITAMSPLAGAVAFAMALPGLASAEDFKITSQADLDTTISLINQQSSGGGEGGNIRLEKGQEKVLEDGDYSHSITFSSSLSGQTLELPSLYVEGSYGASLDIDGSNAPDLTLNMSPASYESTVSLYSYAQMSVSNINLNVQRIASESYAEGVGFKLKYGSSLELDNVTFSHNTENGSVWGIKSKYDSSVSIEDSNLVGGGAPEDYGQYSRALMGNYNSGDISILNSTISGFYSNNDVVGVSTGYGRDVEISGSTFSDNYASSRVLDIYAEAGSATIHDSVFSNNEAGSRIIDLDVENNAQASITNTSIHGNVSERYIVDTDIDWNSSLAIHNTTFSNNESERSMLRIDGSSSEMSITNTSIHGNTVLNGNGRAVVELEGSNSVTALGNVTIANNQGSSALRAEDWNLDVLVGHVTIAKNNTDNAAAVYVYESNVEIVNSIISNNGGDDLYSYYYSVYVDYSLVGSTDGSYAYDAVADGGTGNLLGADPLLGAFAGSGSKAGFRLRADSPAIDTGSLTIVEDAAVNLGIDLELVSDQSANRPRVVGGVPDMGALEWAGIAGDAPANPSAGSSDGVFGNLGFGFLSSMFALGWLRRKLKK